MKKIICTLLAVLSFQSYASCYGVLYVPSEKFGFITKPVAVSCEDFEDEQPAKAFESLNKWINSLGAESLGYSAFYFAEYKILNSIEEANQQMNDFANDAKEAGRQTVFAPITSI